MQCPHALVVRAGTRFLWHSNHACNLRATGQATRMPHPINCGSEATQAVGAPASTWIVETPAACEGGCPAGTIDLSAIGGFWSSRTPRLPTTAPEGRVLHLPSGKHK